MTHTTERVRVHETPGSVHAPPLPPRRSLPTLLGWVAIGAGLFAAVVLVLLTMTPNTAAPRIETEQTPVEQTPAEPSLVGVPRSADGAERYLADHGATRPAGVPRSADAAERHLADHGATRPAGVPQSADAAERYLADRE